ncbi:MAG: signal peptidase II [Clostridia bacterium]|nr:signal peptidase II [Clostridia bacterium]
MLQVITLIIVAILVAIDQIIKLLVIEHLKPIGSLTLIDGFIQLNYAENTGAAFGSFSGKTSLLSVFTFLIIIVGLVYLFAKKRKVDVEYACITLIISGGLGNLIDRVFRGYVVDYIEPLFIDFAIFNFADILVTCSCIALVIWLLFDIYREGKREKGKKDE